MLTDLQGKFGLLPKALLVLAAVLITPTRCIAVSV